MFGAFYILSGSKPSRVVRGEEEVFGATFLYHARFKALPGGKGGGGVVRGYISIFCLVRSPPGREGERGGMCEVTFLY